MLAPIALWTVKTWNLRPLRGILDGTSQRGVVLHAGYGFRISEQRFAFATGYEPQRYVRQNAGSLRSTFALVSEPFDNSEGWPDRSLISEPVRPCFFLRTRSDDRAIIGGNDVPYATAHTNDQLIARNTRTLQRRLSGLFPHLVLAVSYTSAGRFSETKDRLAYIGQVPEFLHACFALGSGSIGGR